MKNTSEIKFLEWSNSIVETNYDVVCVSDILKKFNGKPIIGLDVGGGNGKFASCICSIVPSCKMTVIDKSSIAINNFISNENVELKYEDYFNYNEESQFDFIVFKTVLHHFISHSELMTSELQERALLKSAQLLSDGGCIIVEENFYESFLGTDITGRIIFFLTKLKAFETIFRKLGANTAGEGVRFRSFSSWETIINKANLEISTVAKSNTWGCKFPLWQRIPLICTRRFQAVLILTPIKTSNSN